MLLFTTYRVDLLCIAQIYSNRQYSLVHACYILQNDSHWCFLYFEANTCLYYNLFLIFATDVGDYSYEDDFQSEGWVFEDVLYSLFSKV